MHQVDDVNTYDMLNVNHVLKKKISSTITFIIKYRYDKNIL